jgi:hypothetical protein
VASSGATLVAVHDWQSSAARNNAAWCDALCRSHGIGGRWHPDCWVSEAPPPPGYPDAITLGRDVTADELLARVPRLDSRPGCSIKDSFASLDLIRHGFEVLFPAAWIAHDAGPGAPSGTAGLLDWMIVASDDELAAWEAAWCATSSDAVPPEARIFPPALLMDDDVTITAAHDPHGRVVAGAVLNRGGGVVGVSNVFDVRDPEVDDAGVGLDVWRGCLASAATIAPGAGVVGYELADDVGPALDAGFREVGLLRVWIRDG